MTMKIFISGITCVVRGLTSSELAGGALYIYVRQEIKYTQRQEMKSPNLTDNSKITSQALESWCLMTCFGSKDSEHCSDFRLLL